MEDENQRSRLVYVHSVGYGFDRYEGIQRNSCGLLLNGYLYKLIAAVVGDKAGENQALGFDCPGNAQRIVILLCDLSFEDAMKALLFEMNKQGILGPIDTDMPGQGIVFFDPIRQPSILLCELI